jgi:thiol-disulfide isomerase/thioredoxin
LETKNWAKFFIEVNYNKELYSYSRSHFGDNIGATPVSYYDFFKKHSQINDNILICGSSLSSFTNSYHYGYVLNNALSECNQYPPKSKISDIFWDSIEVNGIVNYTPDNLLRQLVLTEYFTQKMEAVKVEQYEKYKSILDKYITEPYLKEPLKKRYETIKEQIENPKIVSDAILNKMEGTSTKELMNKVISETKGKVIYIDCWATWCAPCRSEMPNSKKMMTLLKDRDVAFVYFCVDSEEKDWKAMLGSFQLGGQQYFLDKTQSTDLRTTFNINGVPTYLLFDKNGVLIEKSTQLRPGDPDTKQKILKLLDSK